MSLFNCKKIKVVIQVLQLFCRSRGMCLLMMIYDYNARGFSEDVGREWENAFFESYNDGIRKVALRISMVVKMEAHSLLCADLQN